ncbi:Uma2 family endonuclease [Rubrobacter marinus]|uniref:Uma2 family endonuclease n=1 Tax=Rubrobacter marinus TaxID=2653852 RepID=A0A6G8PWZ4_9ACTN|nr:Uma2 family endonuclease [Rubrobacter marinus]QIN78732.1 Uma2 family endonuclease [Rubrobacter marinus]
MTVAQRPVTAEELLTMPEDGVRRELVEGEVREMTPAGNVHGRIILNITTPLDRYVRDNGLGLMFAAETGFKIASNPDTVRAPDASFVRRERVEEVGEVEGYWPGAPDLVVEVVSPNDSYAGVEEEVASWLEAGARAVVVVEPRTRTVSVRSSRTEIRVLTEGDVLDVGSVVPGFSMPVADVFG